METAGASVDAVELETAVGSIFSEASAEGSEAGEGEGGGDTISNSDEISLEGFTHAMLKDHRTTFEGAQLSIPGWLSVS